MNKYRVVKEYRPIIGRIVYTVERKGWFLWCHVSFEFSQNTADDLIKHLKRNGL